MKLVEILAREMESWPEGHAAISQDSNGFLNKLDRGLEPIGLDPIRKYDGSKIWDSHQWTAHSVITPSRTASDHSTAIITREMWQAERDRLARANKDGWIRHRGGKCPVEAGTSVDVRHRDGEIHIACKAECFGAAVEWAHIGSNGDIMAWRPHLADRETIMEGVKDAREGNLIPGDQLRKKWDDKGAAFNAKTAEIPITVGSIERISLGWTGEPGVPSIGVCQWRDRIHAIDAEQKAEVERHCQVMTAYDSEREELVQKLAGEGLALLDKAHALMDVVEERHGAPDDDSPGWKEWKTGDLVECVECPVKHSGYYTPGEKYVVYEADPEDEGTPCEVDVMSNEGFTLWCPSICFKWHSRP